MPNAPKKNRQQPPVKHKDDRPGSTERLYDWRWQKARKSYLRRNPLCVKCGDRDRTEPATVVDHIEPHRGNKALFWDNRNWQPLCKRCHDRKTGRGA